MFSDHFSREDRTSTGDFFPTDTSGLPIARQPDVVELADGAGIELRIAPVAKRLAGSVVRLLAYGGSIPGPVLRVRQGSEVTVRVVNDGDIDTTLHWHGLRLDNRYDGTPETQAPIPVGGSFDYRLTFPDPGIYWYHPHIREDYTQEMGLYGNILVVPDDTEYWPAATREIVLTLDDILIEDGKVAPFRQHESTYTAMGRFGNVLLVNGEEHLSLEASAGESIRFFLTNTANTRVFNVAVPGARMKLVGGDSGRYERERFVEHVLIAPSERAVVDVLFEHSGHFALEHRTPRRTYALGEITVASAATEDSAAQAFRDLRTNIEMVSERQRITPYLDATPDKTLVLRAEMDMGPADDTHGNPVEYGCPMHPEVRSARADRCPKCGMKLIALQFLAESAHGDAHHAHPSEEPHGSHNQSGSEEHGHDAGGIEWEDDMVDVNRLTTPTNTRWKLIDGATGSANAAIDWAFRVGDQVKIRIVNEMDSDHPMHHPFHIHGAGRFLILSRDGVPEPNLVWKDTVLLRTGETVDVLLDITNPGRWMAHCHIAEHIEGGMMFSFTVQP